MSLFDCRYRAVSIAALVGVTMALGACGFRPLYGQDNAIANMSGQTLEALATIHIGTIANREGQMLRTALERRLSTRPNTAASLYTLNVTLQESVQELAVERNSFATRANLTLTATYTLVRNSDRFVLAKGAPRAVGSYNLLASQYGTLKAQTDARRRAIETLADDLHTRLSVYFAGPGANAPAITGGTVRP